MQYTDKVLERFMNPRNIGEIQNADALGGFPDHKYHCYNLAASALHKAIMNYVSKSPAKII